MYKITLCAIAAATLAGCSTVAHPGLVEGTPAPRIIKGKHDVPTWTNVGSFGAIRADDDEHAQSVCAGLNDEKYTFRAEGFHSAAIDINGEKFPAGGYYCVAKKRR
ncbi:hypothetical protein [Novosphingobium sp.]|uniref:hypothetical protein n=1 Tax=Novosphingobium sp. TaxID=1874826 RepID=UPI00260FF1A2|nr:hypothetical protein [Novosphingobium sp.]